MRTDSYFDEWLQKEKRGIWLLPVLQFEAFHSPSCKQTERDTHAVGIIVYPKGVRDDMVSHRHTNENGIYLPVASTSAMFKTTNSICGSFELPKTKRKWRNLKCSATSIFLLLYLSISEQSELAFTKVIKYLR